MKFTNRVGLKNETLDYGTSLIILAVARSGSFSSAAQSLGISQSAISQKVQKVERQVGTSIFRRGGQLTALTEHGEVVFRYADQIVSLVEHACSHINGLHNAGTVRIGVADDVEPRFFLRASKLFETDFRDVRLEFRVGSPCDVLKLFEKGLLDIVVSKQLTGRPRGEILWQEELCWLSKRSVPQDFEKPIPLIVRNPPCPIRDVIVGSLRSAQLSACVRFESCSVACLEQALNAGLGVTAADPYSLTLDASAYCSWPMLPDLPTMDCFMEVRSVTVSKRYIPAVSRAVREILLELRKIPKVQPASDRAQHLGEHPSDRERRRSHEDSVTHCELDEHITQARSCGIGPAHRLRHLSEIDV